MLHPDPLVEREKTIAQRYVPCLTEGGRNIRAD